MRRVRCNRGFIVCGSFGRERRERRRERQRSEGRRRRRAEGRRQREHNVRQPCSASLPAGPRRQMSGGGAVIRETPLGRRPASWKSYSCGVRLNTQANWGVGGLGGGGQTGSVEQNQSCVPTEINPIQAVILGRFSKDVK